MSQPVIITCAITGTRPRQADNPAVPITPDQQIAAARAAYDAGASVLHLHVRDDAGNPSSDPGRFAAVLDGVRRLCPGMVVQFSTEGVALEAEARGTALDLRPDMATLATGSVNFPGGTYANPPRLIDRLAEAMTARGIKAECEIFDLAMLYNARALVDHGLLPAPLHLQFVLGIPGALPARQQVLDFLVAELHDLMPDATWSATGVGRHQDAVMDWALRRGGHLRTGLEDLGRLVAMTPKPDNAQLVAAAALRCMGYGARAATPAEARAILGLPAASPA